MDPSVGHLNGILAQVSGNLNNNFQKSQMPGGLPGGWMLKLRFDRYISLSNVLLCANRLSLKDVLFNAKYSLVRLLTFGLFQNRLRLNNDSAGSRFEEEGI